MILRWLFPTPTDKGDTSIPSEEVVHEDLPEPSPTTRSADFVSLPTTQEIVTATATLIVYDLAALRHRLSDECDWWADPKEELEELRERNLLILGLQADGFYDVDVQIGDGTAQRKFSLQFPSGEVFIGPGEQISWAGGEPTGEDGGFFVAVEPGNYEVGASRVDEERIAVVMKRGAPFENEASAPVRI